MVLGVGGVEGDAEGIAGSVWGACFEAAPVGLAVDLVREADEPFGEMVCAALVGAGLVDEPSSVGAPAVCHRGQGRLQEACESGLGAGYGRRMANLSSEM